MDVAVQDVRFALEYRAILYDTLGYVLEKLNHKAGEPYTPHLALAAICSVALSITLHPCSGCAR